jgi:maltose alpha-D-glucosyltransferase/alpha-amylase
VENSFFSSDGHGNIFSFLDAYLEDLKRTKRQGLISIPSGHPDVPRLSLGRNEADIRLAFVFLLTLPGIPSIYYGDEIGMRYVANLASKEGAYWRTGSRTPMQWTRGANAGFTNSDGDKLYLHPDTGDDAPSAEEQMLADDSILSTVRNLIRIRKQNPALQAGGDFTPVFAEPNRYPFVYLRSSGRSKVLVAINPSKRATTAQFKLPGVEPFVELKMLEGIRLRENRGTFTVKMDGQSYGIFSC